MSFSFKAKIYKVGINPCVDVPNNITRKINKKGYIPVKGTINGINSCPVMVRKYFNRIRTATRDNEGKMALL